MKSLILCLAFTGAIPISLAAQATPGPTDPKARKTYAEGEQQLAMRHEADALEAFKKANKQDGGHCTECAKHILQLAPRLDDFKAAEAASQELIAQAQGPQQAAEAHRLRGLLLLQEGTQKKKQELFAESDRECQIAIAADPEDGQALYFDGLALARMKQDDAAKAQFQRFAALTTNSIDRSRALRYVERPELARARMAPAFEVTTGDGRRVSLDSLQGKVVLIDFWATWCGPCREAVPHIRSIARKFEGEPLVILSVSLDSDGKQWQEFVTKNEMTWLQYRDGSFTGPLATVFGVHAIPHTFTIDADGVLQDEEIGDEAIEGKLKKLIARARQIQESQQQAK